MLSDESNVNTPKPECSNDINDEESGAESDPEDVCNRLKSYEQELLALCPLANNPRACEMPITHYRLKDMLLLIIPYLGGHDTTFLSDYLRVLQTEDADHIHRVTYNLMACICDALRSCGEGEELRDQRVVLCAFLCAACVADEPRMHDARSALRRLLARTESAEREVLAAAWWRALPAGQLLLLSDAVRSPRRPDQGLYLPSLAELLLRAALCRLRGSAVGPEPDWAAGAPKMEDVRDAMAEWEKQPRAAPQQEAARVMLVGRVLSVAPSACRSELLHCLTAARPTLQADKLPAARDAWKLASCNLKILFGADDKIGSRKPAAPSEPARGSKRAKRRRLPRPAQ